MELPARYSHLLLELPESSFLLNQGTAGVDAQDVSTNVTNSTFVGESMKISVSDPECIQLEQSSCTNEFLLHVPARTFRVPITCPTATLPKYPLSTSASRARSGRTSPALQISDKQLRNFLSAPGLFSVPFKDDVVLEWMWNRGMGLQCLSPGADGHWSFPEPSKLEVLLDLPSARRAQTIFGSIKMALFMQDDVALDRGIDALVAALQPKFACPPLYVHPLHTALEEMLNQPEQYGQLGDDVLSKLAEGIAVHTFLCMLPRRLHHRALRSLGYLPDDPSVATVSLDSLPDSDGHISPPALLVHVLRDLPEYITVFHFEHPDKCSPNASVIRELARALRRMQLLTHVSLHAKLYACDICELLRGVSALPALQSLSLHVGSGVSFACGEVDNWQPEDAAHISDSFCRLRLLQELELGPGFPWICLQGLSGLKCLRKLRLPTLASALPELPHALEVLHLGQLDVQLMDDSLASISDLQHLRELTMACLPDVVCSEGSVGAFVASLTHLRRLELTRAPLSQPSDFEWRGKGHALQRLGSAKSQLQCLAWCGLGVGNFMEHLCVHELAKLDDLHELCLNNCNLGGTNVETWAPLLGMHSKLTKLDLRGNGFCAKEQCSIVRAVEQLTNWALTDLCL